MEETVPEQRTLVVAFGTSVIAWHLLGVMRQAPHLAARFCEVMASVRRVTCFKSQETPSSPVEERIAKEIQTQRLVLARSALSFSGWMLGVISCRFVLRSALQQQLGMSVMQAMLVFLGYFAVVALNYFPWLLSARTANYWYACLTILSVVFTMPMVAMTQNILNFALNYFIIVQFALGLLSTSQHLVYAANLLTVLTVTLTNSTLDKGECEYLYVDNLVRIVVNTVVVLFALHEVSKSIAADARRRIEHIVHSSERSAASALLGMLCDVVLELDASLCIVDGAAKLAAVLLHSHRGILLTGEQFQNLLSCSEDREQFWRATQASPDVDEGACHMFHVRMNDSCSSQVSMELFTVKFTSVDGTSHHLVGIREFTDVPPMTNLEAVDDTLPQGLSTGDELQGDSRSRRTDAAVPQAASIGTELHGEAAVPQALSTGREIQGRRRSPRRYSRWSGTPARNALEDFGSDSASEVSIVSSGSSRSAALALVYHGYGPTSEKGKILSLVKAMRACNIHKRTLNCCDFHGFVVDAQRTLSRLKKVECQQGLVDTSNAWQCRDCGAMDFTGEIELRDRTCGICFANDTRASIMSL
eukprot:TRINITY_DN10417_c0_g2_i3.p1 TRINITY_DN10417_c0_g2~~TRINITY_DN10417_c0_g2_i3.p1  ORF type:complete len:588 (-),score=76.93 TRINITY_DN10417_c0_g2_i3:297-2060(-)